MKEVVIEEVVKKSITKYEANDGTQFDDKQECQIYEKSARGMLLAKYKKLVTKTISEYALFNLGNEDDEYDLVSLTKESDIDLIMQIYYLHNGNGDYYTAKDESIRERCNRAIKNKELLAIYRGYDDSSFYINNTIESLCENIIKKAYETN
jgi:hypothetical protein